MPATAQTILTASQASPAPAQADKTEKKGRISKRLSDAIRLICRGEVATYKIAAERVGMNYTHLCEAMKKPHIRVFIDRTVRETIANGLPRAGARLMELVDASSEHVSLDASRHMLAIAGIKPAADAQVSVNIDIKAGYVIDISDKPKPVIDVTPLPSD
jgi:hypothetical protein